VRYTTLLFDLDGTIIDTNELIINSFLHTLEQFFPGKYNRELLIPQLGRPLHEQMLHFGGEDLVETLVKVYREHNIRTHDEMVKEFPYVREVLQELYELGATLGVVTTKSIITTKMGLELLHLDKLMSTVVSYEDTKYHKPSPEPVLLAMDRLQAKKEDTLMVGDSQYDIQAAKQAGITAIGVAWSMKGPEFLEQFDPDYLLKDFRELVPIVKGC